MTSEREILRRLRAICAELDDVTELPEPGLRATFKTKKRTFVVYENQPEVHGTRIISIKTTLPNQAKLVRRPGFSPCKFGARHGWVYIDVDRPIDWNEVGVLVRASHGLVRHL